MEAYLSRLSASESEFASAVEGLDDSTIGASKDGESWTIRDILSHVSEMPGFWSSEVTRMIAGGEPRIGRTESDEKRLAALEANRDLPAADLVNRAMAALAALSTLLAGLSPEQLAMTGDYPQLGRKLSVSDIAERHIAHVKEHATEIKTIRAAQG